MNSDLSPEALDVLKQLDQLGQHGYRAPVVRMIIAAELSAHHYVRGAGGRVEITPKGRERLRDLRALGP